MRARRALTLGILLLLLALSWVSRVVSGPAAEHARPVLAAMERLAHVASRNARHPRPS